MHRSRQTELSPIARLAESPGAHNEDHGGHCDAENANNDNL